MVSPAPPSKPAYQNDDAVQEELEAAFAATLEDRPKAEKAAGSIQAIHRGHMGRVGAKKKKSSLAIMHTKPAADFYAEATGLQNVECNVVYDALKDKAGAEGVTLEDFKQVLIRDLKLFEATQGDAMLEGLFAALDGNGNGVINLEELTAGITLFTKGSRADKLAVCFRVFDEDNDGSITHEELGRMFRAEVLVGLRAVLNAMEFVEVEEEESGAKTKLKISERLCEGRGVVPSAGLVTAEEDENNQLAIALHTGNGVGHARVAAAALRNANAAQLFEDLRGDSIVKELVEQVFATVDKNHDSVISLDEFKAFTRRNPKMTEWFDTFAA